MSSPQHPTSTETNENTSTESLSGQTQANNALARFLENIPDNLFDSLALPSQPPISPLPFTLSQHPPSTPSPRAQVSSIQPSSPRAQVSSIQPSSPRAQVSSVQPSSPRAQVSSIQPSSPQAQVSSVPPPSPYTLPSPGPSSSSHAQQRRSRGKLGQLQDLLKENNLFQQHHDLVDQAIAEESRDAVDDDDDNVFDQPSFHESSSSSEPAHKRKTPYDRPTGYWSARKPDPRRSGKAPRPEFQEPRAIDEESDVEDNTELELNIKNILRLVKSLHRKVVRLEEAANQQHKAPAPQPPAQVHARAPVQAPQVIAPAIGNDANLLHREFIFEMGSSEKATDILLPPPEAVLFDSPGTAAYAKGLYVALPHSVIKAGLPVLFVDWRHADQIQRAELYVDSSAPRIDVTEQIKSSPNGALILTPLAAKDHAHSVFPRGGRCSKVIHFAITLTDGNTASSRIIIIGRDAYVRARKAGNIVGTQEE